MTKNNIVKKEFDKYLNSVQKDKGLGALSDVKVMIDLYNEKGYDLGWEMSDLIEKIEEITKTKTKNRFVNEIFMEINNYYVAIGKEFEKGYGERNNTRVLLNKICKIIEKAKIPANYEAVSRLKLY